MTHQEFDEWFLDRMNRDIHSKIMIDAVATRKAVNALEDEMGVALPNEYRHFVVTHGSGAVIFDTIASPDPTSSNYILGPQFDGANRRNGDPVLRVQPDGCGGFYGFRLVNGVYQPEIVYIYDLEETCEKVSASLFEHLLETLIPEHLR